MRLLLVEPHLDVRLLLNELVRADCKDVDEIFTTSDPHEGLAAIQRKRFDIVVLAAGPRDIDTVRQIVETCGPIPVIATTTAPKQLLVGQLQEAGVCEVVDKVAGVDAVCRAIDRCRSNDIHVETNQSV